MRVVVAEPDAGAVRPRHARAVPRARPIDAVAVDLTQIRDPLADVENGGEGRAPRHVAERITFYSRSSQLFLAARPGEIWLNHEDLRFDVLEILGLGCQRFISLFFLVTSDGGLGT